MILAIKKLFKTSHEKISLFVGLLLASAIFPIFVHDDFLLDIFIMTYFYSFMALSWNLLGGKTGMFSLGHAAFFGIGAYVSTLLYLKFGISPWIGILAAALISGIAGIIFLYPCFRLHGLFFALATLAFAEMVLILFDHFSSITGGGMGQMIPFTPGLKNLMFETKSGYYYIFWIALILGITISYAIAKSKFGWRLEAIREDEQTAQTLGINVPSNKLAVVGISSFLAGAGGTLYAQYVLFISPDYIFSWVFSVQFILISIVGGLHTVMGPVLGSLILTPLDVISRFTLSKYVGISYAIYGLVLMIMAVYFREGLLPLISKFLIKKRKGKIKFSEEPSFDIAQNTLEFVPVVKSDSYSTIAENEMLLKLEGLSKNFYALQVLTDVSFTLRKGEILGLIGPNGAGKTTILNIISGFLLPDEGLIWMNNKSIVGLNPTSISRLGVGRTFQVPRPFSKLTVVENVVVACLSDAQNFTQARRKAMEILHEMNLAQYKDQRPDSLPVAMRKRLEIARALAAQPKLLLLDEVMAGLRPSEVDDFIKIINRISSRGIDILIIEHVMRAIAALCDKVVVINFGKKIAEDSVKNVLEHPEVIDAYLGK
jgi:branched-chain amino acid transport system permease protein